MTVLELNENKISIPEFIKDFSKNDQSIMTYNMFIKNNIHYRYEIVRCDSFKNWTIPYIKSEKLAASGFYFTGRNETIKCFACHLEISKWPSGISVVENHKIFSPKCRFACKLSCDNVPIEDKRNVYDMEHNEFMLYTEVAKYPNYRFYQTRFNSFESWPSMKIQTGQQLAEAGFYYTGQKDEVICFYCGIILKEWTDYEDPWEAHYRWTSTCFYILTIKGEDYLHNLHEDAYERERKTVACCNYERKQKVTYHINPKKRIEAGIERIRTYMKDFQSSQNKIEDVTNNTSPIKDKSIKNTNLNKLSDVNVETSESEKAKSELLCKICLKKERNMFLDPCGHILTCHDCCKIALKIQNNKCFYCDVTVKESIEIQII